MTRIPRDVDGEELASGPARLGYHTTRQVGSHMRLTTEVGGQHVTIPRQRLLRVGIFSKILADVGAHHGLGREELLRLLFDRRQR